MVLFFTSDTHFGHARTIEISGRPHSTLAEMNADIVDRWNSRVSNSDTIIHLGDVALGRVADTLDVIQHLNGEKWLVPGNHDRAWIHNKENWKGDPDVVAAKFAANRELYLSAGFARIIDSPGSEMHMYPIILGGITHYLSHLPYRSPVQVKGERYAQWRPKDEGARLICGHVHKIWQRKGNMVNVGVDAWAGYPVSAAELLAAFENPPRQVPTWRL